MTHLDEFADLFQKVIRSYQQGLETIPVTHEDGTTARISLDVYANSLVSNFNAFAASQRVAGSNHFGATHKE